MESGALIYKMDRKQKTAAISALLNLALTLFKFFLFSLTGSLAILAEAWHSLTDIFTSLMVLFSVNPKYTQPEPEEKAEPALLGSWKRVSLEKRTSLIIGIFILAAGIGVVRKVAVSPPSQFSSPFLYGIFFILFALGSYTVYKFETKVGREERSSALIADGLHSQADMLSALLVGFSLIIRQLGVDLDKAAALVIVVFIFSFALKTFLNFYFAVRGKTNWDKETSFNFILAGFNRESRQRLFQWIGRLLNWEKLSLEDRGRVIKTVLILVAGGIVLILSFNCMVFIGSSQQGIRVRLGKVVNPGRPLGPGLHYKLPLPLAKIIKVDSRSIRSMNIGNATAPRTIALLWTIQHGTEESFLSGDNNFFYPYLVLHYRIKDIFDFTYRYRNPEELLNDTAHSLISQIFAGKRFYEIVTVYREKIGDEIKSHLQRRLDELHTGLEIISVNAKDMHPPVSIAASFEEVIAALQEKEKKINEAIGYRNKKIPEARGMSSKSESQAKAYVSKKINYASGDARRFLDRLEGVASHQDLIRPLLYRQAMKESLSRQPLILIDPAAGVPSLWMKAGSAPMLEDNF